MRMRINHEKVIKQARAISEIAKDLQKCEQLIRKSDEVCGSAWKSEAANVFRIKLYDLEHEIGLTSGNIDNLARVIKYCADRIEEEDMEAAKKARRL